MDLAVLKFKSDTSELLKVKTTLDDIVKVLEKTEKPFKQTAMQAEKLAQAQAKTAEANAKAATAQQKTNEQTSKAVEANSKAAAAQQKVNEATARAEKALDSWVNTSERSNKIKKESVSIQEREANILEFMLQGFSKGQSGILATAKATGQLTKELEEILKVQRQISGSDPFDKSMSGLRSIQNEYKILREVQNLYGQGVELTTKQVRELALDKERLIIKMTQEKKSATEITTALDNLNKEYTQTAQQVNKISDAENLMINSKREAAKATKYLSDTDERLRAALNETNQALDRRATDTLVKYEKALHKSGLGADEAAAKMQNLRGQLDKVASKEQVVRLQHLSRAVSVQMGDVAVSLASGMNPLLVMIQQGDQIRGAVTQAGASTKEMQNVMSTALGQIATSFVQVGAIMGSFFVGSIMTAGKAITDFVGKITGVNKVMDTLRLTMMLNDAPAGLTKSFEFLSSAVVAMTGLIAVGLVAALGALAVGLVSSIKEADKLAVSMALFGNAMGLTHESAVSLVNSLEGVSSAKASEALMAMAKTGQFTSSEFSMVAKNAADMQKYAGVAIDETVASYAKMKDDPVKALVELAKQSGMVSSDTIKLAYDLKGQEDQAKLTALGMETLATVQAKQVEIMKKDLSGFAIFMKELGSSISKFFDDAFKAIWVNPTEKQKIEQQIEALQPSLNNKLLAENTKKQIDLLQARLSVINESAKAEQAAADERKKNLEGETKIRAEIAKYEDKDKVKMNRAGSKASYITSELEAARRAWKDMTKEAEASMAKIAGEKWDSAHKKSGKSETEKEQDRIKKYYDRIVEGANNAKAETEGLVEGMNKYQVMLKKIENDEYFSKLNKTQQENIRGMYAQAAQQEDLNNIQKLYNSLLGTVDGLGADYIRKLEMINRIGSKAYSPDQLEELRKKLYETTQQSQDLIRIREELRKYAATLQQENLQLELQKSLIGATTVEQEIANRENEKTLAYLRATSTLESQIATIRQSKLDSGQKDAAILEAQRLYLEALANIDLSNQLKQLNQYSDAWKLLIENIDSVGQSMQGAFGKFGADITSAAKAFSTLSANSEMYARQLESAKDDKEKYSKISKKATQQELLDTANLAGSVKGLFKEKTAAYKAFSAIEKIYHVARIGMMVAEMVMSKTSVAATATDVAAKQSVTMGGMIVDGTAAVVKTLASLPFPANVAAGAAVAALVAGLIGGVGGSFNGGGNTAALPQNTGTGTVFGDSSAKSESITKSIELLSEANSLTMKYSPQMLLYLRNIDANIGGLVNLIIRTGDVQNATSSLGIKTGSAYSGVAKAVDSAVAPLRDFVTKWLPVVGAGDAKLVNTLIGGILGKVSTKVTGQGLTGSQQSLGDILSNQFQGQYYTDVQTKKKSWFSSSTKTKTYLTDAGAELEQQVTAVFDGIYDSILTAASSLGQSESTVSEVLKSFVVDIGRVSLEGTGQEIQDRLSAVFGAAADNIAKAAMPGLEQFQAVGEGYFTTLIRVATEMESVNTMLGMMGDSLFSLDSSGVTASQSLIKVFGGLSEFQSITSEYYDKFYTEEEKIAKQTEQLRGVFSSLGLILPETNGNLQDSLNAYRELVNALDLNDSAQQQTYKTLLSVSDAFYSVANAAVASKASVEDLLAKSKEQTRTNDDIAKSILDYQKQIKQLQATYSDLITGATGANSAVYKLATESMHILEKAAYDEMLSVQASIDAKKAEIELQKKLQELNKNKSLADIKLLQAQGKTQEALAAQRLVDISNMSDAEIAAYDYAKAIDDQITAINNAKNIANERAGLEKELLNLLGKTDELRQQDLQSLDESNRSLKEHIWLIQDLTKAYDEAKSATDKALQSVIDSANTQIEIHKQSFTATDDALRAVKDSVDFNKSSIEKSADEQIKSLQQNYDAQKEYADKAKETQSDIYDTQLQAANDLKSALENIFNTLTDSIKELRSEVESTALLLESQALSTIRLATSTGVIPSSDAMNTAIGTATSAATNRQYVSSVDRSRSLIMLSNELEALQKVAGKALSDADRTIISITELQDTLVYQYNQSQLLSQAGLDLQIKAIEEARDLQLANLDSIYTQAESQVNELRGVNTNILGTNEVLSKLQTATDAERFARTQIKQLENQISVAQTQVEALRGIYSGIVSVTSALAVLPIAIANEIAARKVLDEQTALNIPAFADGANVLSTDMIAQVHAGEAIIPAKFNPWNGGGLVDNSSLVEELQALRTEVTMLRAETRATAINTSKIAKQQDRFNDMDTLKVTIVADQTVV